MVRFHPEKYNKCSRMSWKSFRETEDEDLYKEPKKSVNNANISNLY